MATEEEEAKRDKRSLYLLIAGVAGLLLPLIAVAYMRMREASVPAGATTGGVFENRGEGARNRIKAALTPAPASSMPTALSSPAPTAAAAPADPAAPARKSFDSIGFIKGGNDYFQEAAKPAASVQAPAKTVAAEPEQEEQKLADAPPQAPAAKKGKKAFTMPKLQPSGGTGSFTSFKGGQGLGAGRQGQQGGGEDPQQAAMAAMANAAGGAAPAAKPETKGGVGGGMYKPASGPGSGANLSSFGKKAPQGGPVMPGAPGGAPGGQPMPEMPAGGGMPDMGALLKGVPGKEKTGGVDIGGMLQGIPGMGGDPKK